MSPSSGPNNTYFQVSSVDPDVLDLIVNGELCESASTNRTFYKRIILSDNARFYIGWEVDAAAFKEPAAGSATKVNRGLGTAYDFSDGNEEHIYAGMRITNRWITTEDLQIVLIWDSSAISKECDWEVKYLFRAANEDMTETTPDGTVSAFYTSSGTANGMVHSIVTIPTAAFDTGDKVLQIEILRDGNDVGDTLSASAYLHRFIVRGMSDKLGGAI